MATYRQYWVMMQKCWMSERLGPFHRQEKQVSLYPGSRLHSVHRQLTWKCFLPLTHRQVEYLR